MNPLYGTTMYGTELILDMWLIDKEKAINELILHISVNKPETIRNTQQVAIDWILENFEIHITITSISQESWQFHITKIGGVLGAYYEEDFNSPEEAKETAINYVLINLL